MNALVVGTALSSLLALTFSLALGKLYLFTAVVSLFLGFFISWKLTSGEEHKKVHYQFSSFLLFSFLVITCYLQFLYLFYPIKDKWWSANTNNMADLPLHINMIRAFAAGLKFWPENLEFAGAALKYPFAMDFFSSFFEVLGVSTRAHLFAVGFIFALLSMISLWRWGGAFLVAAFFLSGGFDGFNQLLVGNSWYPGSSVAWKNLFLSVFVTQRGFMFALPAGIFLLEAIRRPGIPDRKKLLALNIVIAAFPFFHLHSFFILSILTFAYIAANNNWKFLKSLFPGLIIAALFTLHSAAGGSAEKALGLSTFWTWDGQESLVFYLLKNFAGVFISFGLLIFYVVKSEAKKKQKFLQVLPLLLFFLFMFVKLAPWAWDNVKVLVWCYLIAQKELYDHLKVHFSELKIKFMFCILFFPGFFMLGRSFPLLVQEVEIFRESAVPMEISRHIPVNDTVLGTSDYFHPLYLSGKKMMLGFTGHLWSFGINYAQREQHVADLMSGQENWQEAAKVLGAKWLYWGENERLKYGEAPTWTKAFLFARIGTDSNEVQLFDLRPMLVNEQEPRAGQ